MPWTIGRRIAVVSAAFVRGKIAASLVWEVPLNLLLFAGLGQLALSFVGPRVVAQTTTPSVSNRQSIIMGEGLLERSVLLLDKSLGTVTDIIRDPSHEAKLGVAGLGGAVFLRADHSVVSRVRFAPASRAGALRCSLRFFRRMSSSFTSTNAAAGGFSIEVARDGKTRR